MSQKRWKFINSADPESVVVVHDEESARVLNQALSGGLNGPWSLSIEESPADTPEARPVVKPATRRADQTRQSGPLRCDPDEITAIEDAGSGPARKNKRYQVRLWAVLVSGVHTFSSVTRDVSKGGMALEEKIPPHMFGAFCRIYIQRSGDGERVELRSRIFADPRNPRRLKFIDPPEAEINRLMKWVEEMDVAGKAA